MEQLQHQSWAELCWYFPDSREQFRIAGRLTIVGEDYPEPDLVKVAPKRLFRLYVALALGGQCTQSYATAVCPPGC